MKNPLIKASFKKYFRTDSIASRYNLMAESWKLKENIVAVFIPHSD